MAFRLYFILSLNRSSFAFQTRYQAATPPSAPAPPTGSANRQPPEAGIWQGRCWDGRGTSAPKPGPSLALFGISETGGPVPASPGRTPGRVWAWPVLAGRGRPARPLPPGPAAATGSGPGSLLVVIGGVGEGELEAVGLGQQQADVLVAPVGGGQVLQEEQQLLKISFF